MAVGGVGAEMKAILACTVLAMPLAIHSAHMLEVFAGTGNMHAESKRRMDLQAAGVEHVSLHRTPLDGLFLAGLRYLNLAKYSEDLGLLVGVETSVMSAKARVFGSRLVERNSFQRIGVQDITVNDAPALVLWRGSGILGVNFRIGKIIDINLGVLAGMGYGHIKERYVINASGILYDNYDTGAFHIGPTIGVRHNIGEHWAISIEYRYIEEYMAPIRAGKQTVASAVIRDALNLFIFGAAYRWGSY
jgi:opacity protein-like surface antigen